MIHCVCTNTAREVKVATNTAREVKVATNTAREVKVARNMHTHSAAAYDSFIHDTTSSNISILCSLTKQFACIHEYVHCTYAEKERRGREGGKEGRRERERERERDTCDRKKQLTHSSPHQDGTAPLNTLVI